MKFYIVCPANIVSGGPELAHQLCNEISKNGYEAYMYYVKKDVQEPYDVPAPEKFLKYNTKHANSFIEADKEDNVVVVPESLTDWAFLFEHAKIASWWMSVDNFNYVGNNEYLQCLDMKTDIHMIQSKYAGEYLKKNGVLEDKIIWLSDYLGDLYMQFVLPPQYRKDVVVFNPKKGFDNIIPFMETCDFVEWKPLMNMTEEEMVLNMQIAKIYIDFGNHPGKDRIPREAASCGCCIITNREGSAAYYEDVPIDDEYKFDMPINKENVIAEMKKILADYENHFKRFENYRDMIKQEKAKFAEDTVTFIEIAKGLI